jgi:hypothetical protein
LDTRSKIISYEQALNLARNEPVRWLTVHFDPLLAEHARRIQAARAPGHRLIVVVTNPALPLLPQRARAELVAALADVDYAVMQDGISEEAEDAGITREFVDHVRRRNSGDAG